MIRGTIYGDPPPPRLHPRHVRDRQFATAGFGRRGLDPKEVRHFLHRVAIEVAALNQDVNRLREENARIKRVLHDYRSGLARRTP